MNEPVVGVVLESESFESAVAAVTLGNDVRPGTFLRVKSHDGSHLLAVVRGVRSAGGVFTKDTAAFHLDHLDEVSQRTKSTFQIAELRFVATVEGANIIDRRPQALLAGSTVFGVTSNQLSSYLGLEEKGGLILGEHARHCGLRIAIRPDDLRHGHMAILGQTGSGKTNVLRLLHSGLRRVVGAKGSYVLFDFHDEFDQIDKQEMCLYPPFNFGPGDLRLEILLELLPGLSVPQQDILAVTFDQNPASLASLIALIARTEGSEASKRVVLRRLRRLENASAFSENGDIGDRVTQLAAHSGTGTILRLGAVQTELAQLFISNVVRRLMLERMKGRIPPMLFLVDEAHRLMSTQSSPTATRTFRFVAQEGRKFGVTMVLATQRPSLIDSTILSQCATMLALRLTSPDDARAVSQVMTEIRPSDLGSLGIGQGLLSRSWSTDVLWINFDLAKQSSEAQEEITKNRPTVQQELFDA